MLADGTALFFTHPSSFSSITVGRKGWDFSTITSRPWPDPFDRKRTADMAERVLDDDEKVVPVEPAGAAQDLSLREPGQHLGYDPELASGLEKQYDLDATRTITQTTIASTFPPETRSANPPGQKPWYKKLNPLKHGKAIPVPTERTVSREYGASLLSILTFQWMAPLMKVPAIMIPVLSRRSIWAELTGD